MVYPARYQTRVRSPARQFYERRKVLIAYWCGEMNKKGTAKCRQMEFGTKMQETESGDERKRLAAEFKRDDQSLVDDETKEMMATICRAEVGKVALFEVACGRHAPESDVVF